MIKLIIFASGSGTNAENIVKYFEKNENVMVSYILSNKRNAKVLDRANQLSIPAKYFSKDDMKSDEFVNFLKLNADYIVLAGFLLKISPNILEAFPDKIINIHPALLPKYGGKGMYGMHVHDAVVKNKESESGITIHFVNENYDEGAVIFQESVKIDESDSSEMVAKKIHFLEYEFFPRIIEQEISKK